MLPSEIQSFIDKKISKRHTNKVLHCHPSPLFWKTQDFPLREIMERRKQDLLRVPKKLNLYISNPFCLPTKPEKCGYCLFPHEKYTGGKATRDYFAALKKEGALYRDFFSADQLAAIYFGGGTPNIYPTHFYQLLMEMILEVFVKLPPNIEITMEGNPSLFTREKLLCLKGLGVNRISLGVQQLDDALIWMSGRRQKSQQILQVLEWCQELGLRTNVDLIYGWPNQTVATMLQDLKLLMETGIHHLTVYELNLGGKTDFARNRKKQLPSIEQNLEMFHLAKQFLDSNGFRQVTTYDYEKEDPEQKGFFVFEDNMRRFFSYQENLGITGSDMWGWGYGGVTYFLGTPDHPGCVYMNQISLPDYYNSVKQNHYPIERVYQYDFEDHRICWILQRLQSLEIDIPEYRAIFQNDLLAEFGPIWENLSERKWIGISPHKIKLTGDGIYFTPLIQSVIAEKRIQEIRDLSRNQ
jgi:oxygen-independent coproporphyrinogen III oxidase